MLGRIISSIISSNSEASVFESKSNIKYKYIPDTRRMNVDLCSITVLIDKS